MDLAHFWNTSGAYEIKQSLRFNSADSAYLNRTPASSGSTTTWTLSCWVKRAALGSSQTIWSAGTSAITILHFQSDDTIRLRNSTVEYITNWKFRDPSAWYHILLKWDTTNGTQADRAILYVNGRALGTGDYSLYDKATSSEASTWNTNVAHNLGRYAFNGTSYLSGYLAEVNFIDGTALTPSSFGETDTITGAWIPKKYSGSYGTNGFYLNFSDNSGITSTTLGKDSSGNGNNWTPNNFSVTAGAGNDVLSDTPTNNWCTLNPLDKNTSASAPSDGNLSWNQSSAAWYAIRGTVGVTSGKWYWETKLDSGLYGAIGIGNSRADLDGYSAESNVWSYVNNGRLEANGTGSVWGNTYTTGDVVGVALDADAGKLWFSKNGTWQESGDPSAGTNPAVSGLAADSYFPYFVHYQTTITANFGQRSFSYTPPSNFKALCTANLPEPTIKKGSTYFDTVTYAGATSGTAGAGTTQAVTGLGFSPDLVWIKNRSNANSHGLFDQVRGAVNALRSDLTNVEATTNSSGALSAFNSNGFTLANGSSGSDQAILTHQSGYNYVAWAWDANGAGSSNTAGTITSTVSANASAGFSIVTYTGIAGDNISATVGHGLGVAPNLIIIKNRDWASSAAAWQTYHSSIPSTGTSPVRLSQSLSLDTTDAASGNDFKDQMNNTLPTSAVFSVSSHDGVSAANRYRTYGRADKYVAYCFSEVAGYSKFGSYTGNGSSDGPFVFCGFRPKLLIWKRTDSSANWFILDAARNTYNVVDKEMYPDQSAAESTFTDVDFLSNGFKLRASAADRNGSGATFIFAAWAELPFKFANAR